MKTKGLGRRGLVRIISYGAAALIITAGFAIGGWYEAHTLRRYIEASYQSAFFDIVGGVSSINNSLQKSRYATSPAMIALLSGEVARESAAAQSQLSQLPFSFEELEETSRFLSRVGDWARSMARAAASGQPLNADQRSQLDTLAGAAQMLSSQLLTLQMIISEENLRIGEVIRAEASMNDAGGALFAGMFKTMSEEFMNLPAIIYDGPFSEHIDQMRPEFLVDKHELSADEAMRVAVDFLGAQQGQLTLARENSGRIPTYVFTGYSDGGEVTVEITRQGGCLLSMINSRTPGDPALTEAEAVEKAAAFLEERGFAGMKNNYYINTGSCLLANFAYEQRGVTCYPDLIKVGVALDTGRIVRVEAMGYVLNHKARELAQPKITAEQAWGEGRTPDLTLESSRMVVIPSPGQYELMCHELRCVTGDGVHVMIYVNAETGIEEKILILIEDENGTLAA